MSTLVGPGTLGTWQQRVSGDMVRQLVRQLNEMRPAGPIVATRPDGATELSTVLETEILAGHWLPGMRLPSEKLLCQRFGVSRALVREAAARLKADGWIETRQGAGAFVAPQGQRHFRLTPAGSSEARLHEVFELRLVLEAGAAELAALRATPADLDTLRAALYEMDEATAQLRDGARADDRFHLAIGAAGGNAHLVRLLEMLGHHVHASRQLSWTPEGFAAGCPQQAQAEHRAILRAIELADPEAARAAARTHLRSAARRLGVDLDAALPAGETK